MTGLIPRPHTTFADLQKMYFQLNYVEQQAMFLFLWIFIQSTKEKVLRIHLRQISTNHPEDLLNWFRLE